MAWDDIPDWSVSVAATLLEEVRNVDAFTFHHCCRVGRNSRRLAKAMGLNEFEQAVLEYAGLFHDIGKARIPKEVLTKPGRLDKNEIEVMKSHPMLSAQMIQHLDHIPFFRFMLPGVRYHHETIEGTGYPNSIRGESIPIFARVIAVVDSFDAMTHARSYRKPLPQEKAIQEIKDFSGRQFDAQIAKYFLDLLPHLPKDQEKAESEEVVIREILRIAA
ncbi:MAG: HD-GYP domain-containing protein [Bdellovibrionales bacterium]